jgi:transcriptional regulator with XRE-family HTH domain
MPVAVPSKPDYKFARRLRQLREKKGWTQEQLARAADLTLAAVRKLERLTGKPVTPLFDTAQRLATALGVTLDKLAEEG